jgi:7,8-dihydropterin-6-yl-methyl-4-(beta-D-ribofuranosyl)aminobenzene 5'-phosphate synthase
MKCTIVYDNTALKGFRADWGFSCLLDNGERRILFDTGANSEILLGNMEKLNIDPHSIDEVFISHGHHDHAGGLIGLLGLSGRLPVYVPHSISESMRRELKETAEIVGMKEARGLGKGAYSTGELQNGLGEQSLVVAGKAGNILICGCSHPGLENILAKAREFGEIYGVLGGFHGFDKFDALEGLKLIVPCHCTKHKQEIFKRFPKESIEGGAGKVIEL